MPLSLPQGILKSKTERGILALTILFAGIILAAYAWGIKTMAVALSESLSVAPSESPRPLFNLDMAKTVNTRGQLVP